MDRTVMKRHCEPLHLLVLQDLMDRLMNPPYRLTWMKSGAAAAAEKMTTTGWRI